ncbi:hypothetical protein JW979_16325 [bacterium]|nr:hypothetical protein [candidate division CSSED10-310 bacterium]
MIKTIDRRILPRSILLLVLLGSVALAGDRNPFSCYQIQYWGDNPTSESTISFMVSFDEVAYNFNDESDLVITETGTVTHTIVTYLGGGQNFPVDIEGVTGVGTMTIAVSTESDVQNGSGDPLDSSVTSVVVNINNPVPDVPVAGPIGISVLVLCLGVFLMRNKQ